MGKRTWKVVEVVEFFDEPKLNSINNKYYDVPKMRLSCGHVATDPKQAYGNETAFKFQRLGNAFDMAEGKRPKARCYKCGQIAKEAQEAANA